MTNKYVKILLSIGVFLLISTAVLSAVIYFIPLDFVISEETHVPLDEANYISDYSCESSCEKTTVTSQDGIHKPDELLSHHVSFLRTRDYGQVQRVINTGGVNKNTTIKWTDKRASMQTESDTDWYYNRTNIYVNNGSIEQNVNNRLWAHRINKQLYADEFSIDTEQENKIYHTRSSYVIASTENTDFEKRIENKLETNNFTATTAKKNTQNTYFEHIVTYKSTNKQSDTITKISVDISSRQYVKKYTETVVDRNSGNIIAEYKYKFDRDDVSIVEPVWVSQK